MTITFSATNPFVAISLSVSRTRYRLAESARRYGRAWRYARQTLTADDGTKMMATIEDAAGSYALESLSLNSVLELARDRWADNPELPRLAAEAVSRVNDKWNSDGNLTGAAQDWACELIAEYAESDGVELIENQ